MAYWIHHSGTYIAMGIDAINNIRKDEPLHKDEFITIDYISNFNSDKICNDLYQLTNNICNDYYKKTGIGSLSNIKSRFSNPIILNFSDDVTSIRFNQLSDEQVAIMKLEHLTSLNRNTAAFLRRCDRSLKERDNLISDFESQDDTLMLDDDSPADMIDTLDMCDTGDTIETDSFDFDDDNTEDNFEFDESKPNNKPTTNNNLSLF